MPKILFVGGPDVDMRIELMDALRDEFTLVAAGSLPHLATRFAQAGFEYYPYPLGRGLNPFQDARAFFDLWRLFRRLRPHIVHTFDTKPCVLARLAARLAGVPVVVGTLPGLGSLYVSNSITIYVIRMIYEGLQKLACSVSNVTIFLNPDDAQRLISKKIVSATATAIVPGSGINTGRFDPARIPESQRVQMRAELGISPDAVLVTMIARVIRTKGVLEFCEAAQALQLRRSEMAFLLVGGTDEDSVDHLSNKELNQLKQSVIWPGSRSDIPSILAATDIFVLPSYREGFPRVLLEAASMALPIVATDAPGCREVVEHGANGLLVPPRDSKALAEAILRLGDDKELRERFGRESRRKAIARFDVAEIARQLRAIYWANLQQRLAP